MADQKPAKKQMYPQRALNTFGAKLTGRGAEVAKDTMGMKYLTAEELAEYKPKKKTSAKDTLLSKEK